MKIITAILFALAFIGFGLCAYELGRVKQSMDDTQALLTALQGQVSATSTGTLGVSPTVVDDGGRVL